MAQSFAVSELTSDRGQVCRAILSSLPEWFGIPEAVDDYVAAVEGMPMLIARTDTGRIVGFLSLKLQTDAAAEAYVLGVRRDWHRQGIGSQLFEAASALARSRGCRYLTVKTLAASHPDPHYRTTRSFYEAIGFEPVEVFPTLWGSANPCLLMIKRLD